MLFPASSKRVDAEGLESPARVPKERAAAAVGLVYGFNRGVL